MAGIVRSRGAFAVSGPPRGAAAVIEGCGHAGYVANARKAPYIRASGEKDGRGDACALATW